MGERTGTAIGGRVLYLYGVVDGDRRPPAVTGGQMARLARREGVG